uniref:Transposase n=1 Tax=Romanomermis culicivorax TaxID=13658 RepID=A0A915HUX6_ROMCU
MGSSLEQMLSILVKVTNRDIIYVTDGGMTPLDMAGQLAAWGLVPAQGTLPCPKCGKTMTLGVDNNRLFSAHLLRYD